MEFLDNLMAANEESRMMQLLVRFSSEKNCWVCLPPHMIARMYDSQLPWPLVLELQPLDGGAWRKRQGAQRPVHVACAGGASRGDYLEVPAGLALALGLMEGSRVAVRALPNVPAALSVTVEPSSPDDWELVEMNADHMEEQLLNQVGVASVGEPIPFWVRGQAALRLTVSAAEPGPLVRLVQGTEVAVAPRPRARSPQGGTLSGAGIAIEPVLDHDKASLPNEDPTGTQQQAFWMRLQEPDQAMLRTVAVGEDADVGSQLSTWPSTSAFISPDAAQQAGLRSGDLITVCRDLSSRSMRLTLRLEVSGTVGPAHIMLMPPAVRAVGATPCTRVAVLRAAKAVPRTVVAVQSIVLHPVQPGGTGRDGLASDGLLTSLRARFLAWFQAQDQGIQKHAYANGHAAEEIEPGTTLARVTVPIQSGTILEVFGERIHESYFLELRWAPGVPRSGNYVMLSPADVSNQSFPLELGAAADLPGAAVAVKVSGETGLPAVASAFGERWQRDYALPALKTLLPLLHHTCRKELWRMRARAPGGLLLCGPTGSGKSDLLTVLERVLTSDLNCLTHVVHIYGRDFDLDRPVKTQTGLITQLQGAVDKMPALVIIHDIHLLCPADGDSPDAAPNPGAATLASWLRDVISSLHQRAAGGAPYPVVFCGTAPDAAAVAAVLRGPGMLDHVIRLAPPGTDERSGLLRVALESRHASFRMEHLQAMAGRADGYDAEDLRVLADRALHAALRRRLASGLPSHGPLRVEMEDLEEAQEGFQPSASWGVGSAAPSGTGPRGWQDVGGAAAARSALQEALELPSRYSKLIAKAPLRLRTGVLLFGPPGCGKTHIVGAAVAAAGLRFVSVKGPEVLNKYIGASEAAVRDLFRRASAAAPCVLFFDEFDAIAPQRGHDSTGVTDRVVNQLLTELDGVEGLRGVIVLAATSRPDLLDAALLRPGRLDRLVYCGIPTELERIEIVSALANRLPLGPEVDLRSIAARTEGFTGADLGALLSEAQLMAVHDVLDHPPASSEKEGTQGVPQVLQSHLEAALTAAHPSVPSTERARLEGIYSRFVQSRDPGIGNASVSGKGKGKRATLA
eukprot:jgi/Botrbrau1/5900/Bobra.0366s0078.1